MVALSSQEITAVIEDLAARGIAGGATYDALISRVAELEGVDNLITSNPDHFLRVAPSLKAVIRQP